jgi:hypothetical protein
LFINSTGLGIPDAFTTLGVAEEIGCCEAFKEPDPGLGQPFETTTEPITLTGGQQYGVLFLVKEGGGGDWGQVAMRLVGDPTAATSLSPITVPTFQPAVKPRVDPVGAVVNITQAPASASVVANSSHTFSVTAETSSPYSSTVIYQWYKDGVAIPGANATNYTIPVVASADDGAEFTVLVAVLGKSVTTEPAVLTVTADAAPPTLVGDPQTDDSFTSVRLAFSEPVTAPSATTAGNYVLSGGATVSAATLINNGTGVELTTSRLTEDTEYTLTINNVADNAGNAIAANTAATFTTWQFVAGAARYERWNNIGGTAVSALTSDARFPHSPDVRETVDTFEAPADVADNYGAKVSGVVIPAETGNYVFFISADDNAELYLSTDVSPAIKKLIAIEPVWDGRRVWTGPGTIDAGVYRRGDTAGNGPFENRSDQYADTEWASGATISLTAGERYYLEVIFKEGGGGDNAGALWKLASAADPTNGAPGISGAVIGTWMPPGDGPTPALSVGTDSEGKVVLTFEGTLESTDSIGGTWSDVQGASPLTVDPVDSQKYYRSKQ